MMKKLALAAAAILLLAAAPPQVLPPSVVSGQAGSEAVTATGGTTARTLAARAADVVNVLDFGAKADGVTHAATAINAAIASAVARNVPTVYLPSGNYYINTSTSHIILQSNIQLQGDGIGRTVLLCDDTNAGAQYCVSNVANAVNIAVQGLTLLGKGQTNTAGGQHIIVLSQATGVRVENVESRYSRLFGILVSKSTDVLVTRSRVYRSNADGIAVWESPEATITDNYIVGANDDAISAHTNDTDVMPRSGLIISNNRIEESQGIVVLGAKLLTLTGNKLQRIMCRGIVVSYDSYFSQGNTPLIGVTIANNVVADVFQRAEPNPRNACAIYMQVGQGQRTPGAGTSVPGVPNPSTGAATSLLGTGVGNYYGNNTLAAGAVSPGGGYFQVVNNTLIRTLPASTSWANWGYGTSLWVGNNGDGSGLYSGGIPEANLQGVGIQIQKPFQYSRISGNIIRVSGQYGIQFLDTAVLNGDFDNLDIADNQISDFTTAGIMWSAGTSSQKMRVTSNILDADPRYAHASRGSNGTWASSGGPAGLSVAGLNGLAVEFNQFRDLATPVAGAGTRVELLNKEFGTFASGALSASNTGIGTPVPQSLGWLWVPEDDNPTSTTFGQVTAAPNYAATTNLPTPIIAPQISNAGSVSAASIATLAVGPPYWVSSALAGNLPSWTLQATDGNGSGAVITLNNVVLYGQPGITGGAGCSVGDTLYINDVAGGGIYGAPSTSNFYMTVTSVSSGAVTGSQVGGAVSGGAYLWAKPLSAAATIAAKTSTCTTLPSLVLSNGYSNAVWSYANGGFSLKAALTVTASGSGYTTNPNPIPTAPYTYQAANTPAALFTLTLPASVSITAGAGKVLVSSSGTTLALANTPLIAAAPLLDGTMQPVVLTTSGYTVPPGTSLVRFKPTGTLASATITLPTATGDTQPLLLCMYSGAVTATTFSPAVLGYMNGAMWASNTCIRLRWDLAAAAWYREQQ